jgi:hypothetical protein
MTTLSNRADPDEAGYLGEGGTGVYGRNIFPKGNGIIGASDDGRGVWGHSKTGHGVLGESVNGRGVVGTSETDYGIRGHSGKSAGIRGSSVEGRGIEGQSTNSEGVVGQSDGAAAGVVGVSKSGAGVHGMSDNYVGVWGTSVNHEGVHAETNSTTTAALAAYQMNPNSTTAALYAKHHGNGAAAVFDGDVHVSGDIILANADCAEDFDVTDDIRIEPGTVMVLGEEGKLLPSHKAYDKCVAGVVSGAGDYKPGIVLDKQQPTETRKPIALLGKVYCKVDARHGAIEIGDLLTTSPTAGHAMRVDDPFKALGTIIGKALRPLTEGQGLIPILIALQ